MWTKGNVRDDLSHVNDCYFLKLMENSATLHCISSLIMNLNSCARPPLGNNNWHTRKVRNKHAKIDWKSFRFILTVSNKIFAPNFDWASTMLQMFLVNAFPYNFLCSARNGSIWMWIVQNTLNVTKRGDQAC